MRVWLLPIIFSVFIFITGCQQDVEEQTDQSEQVVQEDQEAKKEQEQEEQKEEHKEQQEQQQEEHKEQVQEKNNIKEQTNSNSVEKIDEEEQITEDKHITEVEEIGLHVVEDPDSMQVYVNKQRKLPDGYNPSDLVEPDVQHYATEGNPKRLMREVAANALESLFAEAKEQGIELVAVSGYRSYERQKQIYQNNVKSNGQEHADKYSAKPGTSEHQTGLAMDIAAANETAATLLEQSFKQTDEGTWLAENAHLAGFIIRYPEGKSAITGYSYEPWHVRYVGEQIATEIHNKEITLEEYFGYDY